MEGPKRGTDEHRAEKTGNVPNTHTSPTQTSPRKRHEITGHVYPASKATREGEDRLGGSSHRRPSREKRGNRFGADVAGPVAPPPRARHARIGLSRIDRGYSCPQRRAAGVSTAPASTRSASGSCCVATSWLPSPSWLIPAASCAATPARTRGAPHAPAGACGERAGRRSGGPGGSGTRERANWRTSTPGASNGVEPSGARVLSGGCTAQGPRRTTLLECDTWFTTSTAHGIFITRRVPRLHSAGRTNMVLSGGAGAGQSLLCTRSMESRVCVSPARRRHNAWDEILRTRLYRLYV